MNISTTPRKRSKKPIVGTGSIIVAFALAYLVLKTTSSPLLAAMAAGVPTYIAPVYYAWKRDPFKAYASAVLASMVSGAIAWIVFSIEGISEELSIDSFTGFLSGIFSAGFISHLVASAYFVKLLDSVSVASPSYPAIASSFLAIASATALGLALILSIRRPRDILSPSVLFIAVASVSFLVISIIAG